MSDYWPERTDFGPLFSAPKARASDPPTSHAAARSRGLTGQKLLVYEALAAGPAGQTELGQRIGMDAHRVNKRLADLESEGLAAPTGDEVRNAGGCLERVWRRIATNAESNGGQHGTEA